MTVKVQGRVSSNPDGKFTEAIAGEIAERFRKIERNLAGSAPQFTAPGTPPFGAGPIIAPGGGGGGGGGGGTTTPAITDHGALTGLEDDDHPQYVERGDAVKPHFHEPFDVPRLDEQFIQHFERVLPAHTHAPQDVVGLDTGEGRAVKAHAHVMGDIADLRPEDWQFVLAARIFGG